MSEAKEDTSIPALAAKVEQIRHQGEERIRAAVLELEEAERRLNTHKRRVAEKMRMPDEQG